MAPRPRTFDETAARFHTLVAKSESDDCWLWTGRVNRQGYGRTTVQGKKWLAHRFAYVLATREEIAGVCILHSCDNPPCCNPAHLSRGDRSENARQRTERGHSYTKPSLDEETARRILDEFTGRRGEQVALAKKYGTTLMVVHCLVRGKTKAFAHLHATTPST